MKSEFFTFDRVRMKGQKYAFTKSDRVTVKDKKVNFFSG